MAPNLLQTLTCFSVLMLVKHVASTSVVISSTAKVSYSMNITQSSSGFLSSASAGGVGGVVTSASTMMKAVMLTPSPQSLQSQTISVSAIQSSRSGNAATSSNGAVALSTIPSPSLGGSAVQSTTIVSSGGGAGGAGAGSSVNQTSINPNPSSSSAPASSTTTSGPKAFCHVSEPTDSQCKGTCCASSGLTALKNANITLTCTNSNGTQNTVTTACHVCHSKCSKDSGANFVHLSSLAAVLSTLAYIVTTNV